MQRGLDEAMGNREKTVLLVSDDAALCAAARRGLEQKMRGLRVSAVSSVAAARRILEEDPPAVILFEEESIVAAAVGDGEGVSRLDDVVNSLSAFAPVVILGAGEHHPELDQLIAVGSVDYVSRDEALSPAGLELIERRLRQSQPVEPGISRQFEAAPEDFGEILRHELNNPLTGILGNAELLLAEIRRKNDGRLPQGGQQRLETIASLAVRLRETVHRLSQEWEARHHPVQ
jgi:signal transduction histidine kinase